jgi:hypothetical protein
MLEAKRPQTALLVIFRPMRLLAWGPADLHPKILWVFQTALPSSSPDPEAWSPPSTTAGQPTSMSEQLNKEPRKNMK